MKMPRQNGWSLSLQLAACEILRQGWLQRGGSEASEGKLSDSQALLLDLKDTGGGGPKRLPNADKEWGALVYFILEELAGE